MDEKCPNCDATIDFDGEFENFDGQGDVITATATYICPECGETLTIRATFVWDGSYEID